LSLPIASRGHISEVALCVGAALPVPSLLWDASLSSDEDDDNKVLAPQMLLASAKGVVFGSALGTTDVQHDEKAPVDPCDVLFAAAAALGDKEG
jgi:hypothetical protein